MFNFISWQLFLTALTLLIALYYLITSPFLYYKEISQRFKSLFNGSTLQSSEIQKQNSLHADLIGSAIETPAQSATPSISKTSAEEVIIIAEDDEPEEIIAASSPANLTIGSVADLLQEIKTLLHLIAEDKTGKLECKVLFNALLVRYPHLHNTSYSQAINFYLLNEESEKFAFDLSLDDLQSWWTPTSESANN